MNSCDFGIKNLFLFNFIFQWPRNHFLLTTEIEKIVKFLAVKAVAT